eukprot:11650702-Ditylum_brightwellii.AAC.1
MYTPMATSEKMEDQYPPFATASPHSNASLVEDVTNKEEEEDIFDAPLDASSATLKILQLNFDGNSYVLCVRSSSTNKHAGNKYFCLHVNHGCPQYMLVEKLQKSTISNTIVAAVNTHGRRF